MTHSEVRRAAPNARRIVPRAAWACAALLATLCFQSIYHQPTGWLPAVVTTLLAVVAFLRPYEALLLLAGLGPLATALFVLIRTGSVGLDFGQALVLAFLAGSAARRVVWAGPLRVSAPLFWSGVILIALTVASGAVNAAISMEENPQAPFREVFNTFIAGGFLISSNTLTATLLFLQGLLLLLVVADECAADSARRATVLRLMVGGASAAALLNVNRIATAALQREDSWRALVTLAGSARVNAQFGDLNAAGSYFALALLVAASFYRRARLPAAAASVLIALALWLTGSRTALGAVLVTGALGALVVLRARWGTRKAAMAIGVLVAVVAAAAWQWYPAGRNAPGREALDFRITMGTAALRLIVEHPIFGVGPGRFYPLSGHSENAHNNFLQIAVELGVPGLLLFLSIVVLAFRALGRAPERTTAAGLAAGLAAFLLTCLAGHPLLVSGAAYPFWIALGVAASAAPEFRSSAWLRPAAGAFLLAVAVTLPFRIAGAAQEANTEHASVGFSKWQEEPGGQRYRWAGGQSAFFVVSTARAVRIPLRPTSGALPLEVRIFVDGREADGVLLTSTDAWRMVRLVLARRRAAPFIRIDLEARVPGGPALPARASGDSPGPLMVGRPIVEP